MTDVFQHVPFDAVPLNVLDGRWDVLPSDQGQIIEVAWSGEWRRITDQSPGGSTTYYRLAQ